MDGDESGWAPPRPTRVDRAADGRPSVRAAAESGPAWAGPAPGGLPSPRRRPRPVSPARAVAISYLALVVVVALIAAVGTLVQPVYGTMAPYGGTAFADVRSQPTASGWRLDLAKTLSPRTPARCIAFHAGAAGEHRELVTASLPTPNATNESAGCQVASSDAPGILTMVDPDSGTVVWTRNLSADLRTTVFSLVWHVSRAAGLVVVGIDGSRGDRLLSIDLGTGRTVSSTSVAHSDEVINFGVSGRMVLSVVPDSGGTLETYYLRRVDHLSKTIWTNSLSSTIFPEVLPDRIIIPMPNETVVIDGATGEQSRWGANLWRNQGILVMGDHVLAVTVSLGVGVAASLVLYDADGHRVWSTPAAEISALDVSRSCVLVSSSSTVTCHEKRTGKARWTAPLDGQVDRTPDGAKTDDILITKTVRAGATALVITQSDGANGHPRFSTTIPRGAGIAGEGTTTGYSLDTSAPTGGATLLAFDLDSGRTLWTLRAPDLAIWGGRLVRITANGFAEELTDGVAARGRAMLRE